MTTDPVVYRSTSPTVIDAYKQAIAQREQWREQVNAFVRQHGDGRNPVTRRGFGSERFVGFVARIEDDDNPPEGWRVDRSEGVLLPDLRRRAGKIVAGQLDAIETCTRPELPGMPHESWDGPKLRWPGMERHGDTVYVRWSAEPDPGPDPEVWERCPLSAYYAAIEADEATADA